MSGTLEPHGHDLSGTRIEVAAVRHPRRVEGYLPPGSLAGFQEAAGVVAVHLELERTRQGMVVRGRLSGPATLTCARCLAPFRQPLEVEVEREFAIGADPARESQEREMEEDLTYLADGFLELRRLVDEEMVLAIPMLPLCQPGCAGLCAGCGADLNHEPCSCPAPPLEGPFAVLNKLKLT